MRDETKARRVAEEVEKKNAELARQRELAEKSQEAETLREERLKGHDKTAADSFPASDPPSAR